MRIAIAMLACAVCVAQQSSDPNVQHARDILVKGLASGNPDTRRAAVVSISLVGDHERAVSELSNIVQNDRDVTVRIAAIRSLGSFKDPKLLPILQQALQDPVPEVDFAAAKVLFDLKQSSPARTFFWLY